MPKPAIPLSSVLPPLVCGTGTFNTQYNADPFAIPSTSIVHRALTHGVRAFDTSPYYGPSETLLGNALTTPFVRENFPRSSYFLLTKAGRISMSSFDYSPVWIRASVARSLDRLQTPYLDLVYCHDAEFVSPTEVLTAIRELRRIRDEEGTIRYVGLSGYPVQVLAELAELVLHETGEPLDAVQSYANYTLQNTRLVTEGLARLRAARVDVVPNASLLGMGLLRRDGIPTGSQGDWHPAPPGLRTAVRDASRWVDEQGDKIEKLAIRWAVEGWMREGAPVGGRGNLDPAGAGGELEKRPGSAGAKEKEPKRLGVSVMGVSTVEELEETMRVWRSIWHALQGDKVKVFRPVVTEAQSATGSSSDGASKPAQAIDDGEFGASFGDDPDQAWGVERKEEVVEMVEGVREVLGKWYDFAWDSPGKGFVNERAKVSEG